MNTTPRLSKIYTSDRISSTTGTAETSVYTRGNLSTTYRFRPIKTYQSKLEGVEITVETQDPCLNNYQLLFSAI